MTKMDAAEKLRKAAAKWGATAAKEKDAEMAAVYMQDQAALLIVAARIAKGEKKRARDKADMLDTIVREEIPHDVWKWLHDRD